MIQIKHFAVDLRQCSPVAARAAGPRPAEGYNLMIRNKLLYSLLAGVVTLSAIAWINIAAATEACQGSYITAVLQPLPSNPIVGLDVRDRSPRNLRLAELFKAGLRQSGAVVGEHPNVVLRLTVSRLGDFAHESRTPPAKSYPEFAGLQGGMQPELPPIPSQGLIVPRSPPKPPLMFVRVDATVGDASRPSWLASIQCSLFGTDEQLAGDLGRLVGSTLGERTERRPF